MIGIFLVLVVALGGEAYVAQNACDKLAKNNVETKVCERHK